MALWMERDPFHNQPRCSPDASDHHLDSQNAKTNGLVLRVASKRNLEKAVENLQRLASYTSAWTNCASPAAPRRRTCNSVAPTHCPSKHMFLEHQRQRSNHQLPLFMSSSLLSAPSWGEPSSPLMARLVLSNSSISSKTDSTTAKLRSSARRIRLSTSLSTGGAA